VARRGHKVVVVQSNYGHAAPGQPYWMNYASAAWFGPGVKNDVADKSKEKCWGGFRKNEEGAKMVSVAANCEKYSLAYPDRVMFGLDDKGKLDLSAYLGGVLVVGGGAITEEQAEIYCVGKRDEDKIIPTTHGFGPNKGKPSNSVEKRTADVCGDPLAPTEADAEATKACKAKLAEKDNDSGGDALVRVNAHSGDDALVRVDAHGGSRL